MGQVRWLDYIRYLGFRIGVKLGLWRDEVDGGGQWQDVFKEREKYINVQPNFIDFYDAVAEWYQLFISLYLMLNVIVNRVAVCIQRGFKCK